MTITGNILDDTTALKVIVADPIPSAELFRWVSGTPVLPYVGLLGCGALGSAIANHLLRGGVSGINAFDKDLLLPHNLARHTGRVSDLYRRKSKQVASLAEAISPLSKSVVRYLYGGWDAALKRIVVVTASPIPPNSRQSESLLDLGPSGATDIERRLASRTQRRIGLCGTWHSHPGSSAAMSLIDNATVQRFYEMDRAVGVPTLLFIVADDTLQCHLRV